MKIVIHGGGPAGLYFAVLMKLLDARHDIQLWEKNPRNATFGWGVVFSGQTIDSLAEADPVTHRRLLADLRTWENVDVVHRGILTSVGGNRFSGIARLRLLNILQDRCEELGVRVHYATEAPVVEADLVVGADGVHSALRTSFTADFQPTLRQGHNRYIWFGTRQSFAGLTLIFRPHGENLFMAHCYRYSPDFSTFIVEVDLPTWRRIRLWPDDQARLHLEEVFAEDLGGYPLLSNQSRWIRFLGVRNGHWWSGNKVLLGDALHTAHFSIGSGTKLAMEDAIALWRAFRGGAAPAEALPSFEAARRPVVERVQAAAATSQTWFETARRLLPLEALPFTWEAMTRSSRVDDDGLQRRDPAFVAAYRAWQAVHS